MRARAGHTVCMGDGLKGKIRRLLRGYSGGLSAAGYPPEVSGSHNTISFDSETDRSHPFTDIDDGHVRYIENKPKPRP